MNVLYHHRTKSRDGQAVHIRELIAALRRRGHAVEEWALSPGDEGEMGSEGGLVGKLAAAAPRICYELAEHAYGPIIAPRLVAAGRACDADVLYERHALNNSAGMRAARKLGVPYLLEVNSPLTRERSGYETLVLQKWAARCERRVLAAADRLLVVTHVLRDILIEDGLPPERVVVIPNGADMSLYPDTPPAERDELVIGFTGFFRPWHGLETLVDALADGALPAGARLLLVGDGPSRSDIEARAAQRGLADRVEITGSVERAAIPDLVRSMDICVQPAATPWASPLKLFEYMAAGRAIVAPDQPSLREVLAHERDALLFEPDDPGAMAAAVVRLGNDAALRTALGATARERVLEVPYTWDGNAARIEEIVAECQTPRAVV
jgi:glycosyltransferase involved in cell wall biosynthesis